MKYFYLEGDLNPEKCNSLLTVLSEHKKVTIYLSSGGGECYASEAMLMALNENHENITLICTGEISSNAFWLFMSFKGKTIVGSHAMGYYHYCGAKRHIMENGRMEYDQDKYDAKESKKRSKLTRKWCEDLGFTKGELGKMERGDVLFFSNERLKELNEKKETTDTKETEGES